MQVRENIERKLADGLDLLHLDVVNESDQHNVPPGSESHFKVVLVARNFENASLVQRHRLVYRLLAEEMAGGVHALALHTYTEAQWQELSASPCSPLCRGGSKAETEKPRRAPAPADPA